MEIRIDKGGQAIALQYWDGDLKTIVSEIIRLTIARHKYMSPQTVSDNLEALDQMVSELVETMKENSRKEWMSLKRKITNFRKAIVKMNAGTSVESAIWNFILSLNGDGNLPGFGFCEMPFRDPIRGDAEKISLYELKKRIGS